MELLGIVSSLHQDVVLKNKNTFSSSVSSLKEDISQRIQRVLVSRMVAYTGKLLSKCSRAKESTVIVVAQSQLLLK